MTTTQRFSRGRSHFTLAAWTLLVVLLLPAAALAAPPATTPGLSTFIMVLRDPRYNPGQPKGSTTALVEPDIVALGGKVDEKWTTRRVIRIPEALVDVLLKDPAVKYLQRVNTGTSQPGNIPLMARIENEPVANAAPPTWYSGEYQYDGSGNIRNIGATTSPYSDGQPTLSSDGKVNSYTYDLLGRLTTATVNTDAGNHSESYTYDAFGNLVQRTTDGTSLTIGVDAGTNRLQAMSYDAAGNLTQNGVENYWYDAESRMRVKMAGNYLAETYLYDADDERVGVNPYSDVWRWTIRDLDGKVLREYEGGSDSSSAWLWVEDDIYRDSQLVAAERVPADGGQRHFHSDHLGTPRLITSAAGLRYANHDYYPFGTELTDLRQEMTDHGFDRPEPRKFTSHERDFTGGTDANNTDYLDYMHARYYNPNVGRFLSIDPAHNNFVLQMS